MSSSSSTTSEKSPSMSNNKNNLKVVNPCKKSSSNACDENNLSSHYMSTSPPTSTSDLSFEVKNTINRHMQCSLPKMLHKFLGRADIGNGHYAKKKPSCIDFHTRGCSNGMCVKHSMKSMKVSKTSELKFVCIMKFSCCR